MRWAHWPVKTASPYLPLFYGALHPYGIVPVDTWTMTAAWMRANNADVLHVHWPESLWRRQGKNLLARLRGVRRLQACLAAARAAGKPVVWTVHNHQPHERGDWIDRWGHRVFEQYVDLFICHSQHSAQVMQARGRIGADRLVMPMGRWDTLPTARQRDDVLRELGLDPELPVVSCIGGLRGYKGLVTACRAVAACPRPIQFIVGGRVHKHTDVAAITTEMARLPRAHLLARNLSDQEYADLVAASDAVLLTYTDVTTSAALLAAWTLGTGAVTSAAGYFRELIPHGSPAGVVCEDGNFAAAIDRYLDIPREIRQREARMMADRYPWNRCVLPVVEWMTRNPVNGKQSSI
jgi:beta-1,4-mannosyltransferase